VVRKEIAGEQTFSVPRALAGDERVEEIARMLGGVEITAETRAHARQLLTRAAA
jgi:DNA repair protein RecN (Recombination protein N)